MPRSASADSILHRCRPLVEAEIERVLPDPDRSALYGIIRYHLGLADARGRPARAAAGKGVRGALCLLACEASGGPAEKAAPAAAAVELLHSFTLLHDDIADRDEVRRGRLAAWRVWGVGRAITAGDALYALANLALGRLEQVGVPPPQVTSALASLNRATLAICEGQEQDLSQEGSGDVAIEAYLDMISKKTAALFATAAGLGASVAGADAAVVAGLEDFGRDLGTAFQVRDDLLGIWGQADEIGKPVGSDLRRNKRSLPIVLALSSPPEVAGPIAARLAAGIKTDHEAAEVAAAIESTGARERCEQLARDMLDRALGRLSRLPLRPGPAADLRTLASYLVGRTQ